MQAAACADYTKTEDTNKTPILPRPRGSFAFPAYTDSKGRSLVPYAGLLCTSRSN